jgi:5'-nucleotidase
MILVSNDDGIHSEGIRALAAALGALDRVVVVAPNRERSAAGHSLTLDRPLRVERLEEGWFSVDGTPTDCVNLAVNGILRPRPRIVVSGVNKGQNLGDDVTYSGTVSAAMEGTLLGIPSLAVSLVARESFRFETAATFATELAALVLEHGLPRDTLLNVNVPNLPRATIPGVAVTRQGRRRYSDAIVENVDPRGRKYYWIGGEEIEAEAEPGTDFHAVREGRISVTPIHLDLTNHASLPEVSKLLLRTP